MGYDVWVDGELTILTGYTSEAADTLRAAIAEREDVTEGAILEGFTSTPTLCQLLKQSLGRFEACEDVNGNVELYVEDSIRSEEEDEWIFRALAPYIEDGAFYFRGDDDYRWRWRIKGGAFFEEGSDTIYGSDVNAPAALKEVVGLVYPPHLDGLPVTASYDTADPEYEIVVRKIEELLRIKGFGPQAGMSDLERLAVTTE